MPTLIEPRTLPDLPGTSDARRRLYEVAIDLFGASGFHAVSVRDLARALGVVPGAIYAHVGSKHELLHELVSIGLDEHASRMRAALLDAGSAPVDQVRALTGAHVLVHLELPALARVINRELRSLTPEHFDAVVRVRDDTERLFVEVVERGCRLGVFDVDAPNLAVAAIAAMGIRTAEWWQPGGPFAADQVIGTYQDFAIRLLTGS